MLHPTLQSWKKDLAPCPSCHLLVKIIERDDTLSNLETGQRNIDLWAKIQLSPGHNNNNTVATNPLL